MLLAFQYAFLLCVYLVIVVRAAGGLPAVACMTVCARLTQLVIAYFLPRLRIIIQPTISGLTICIIALEHGIVGLQHALDLGGERTATFSATSPLPGLRSP